MRFKRQLPESELDHRDRPLKRQSSSPVLSPRTISSPTTMLTPLPQSLDQRVANYTYFDCQTASPASSPGLPTLSSSSEMDTDSTPTRKQLSPSSPMDRDSPRAGPSSSPTPHVGTDVCRETPPALRNREDSAAEGAGDLATLDPISRKEYYRKCFENIVLKLKDVTPPPLCQQYPKFAIEIFDAFLRYIHVDVVVWTNYDSSTQRFYEAANRVESCGKVYLSPEQRAALKNFGDELQLSNIRFLIGTPFRVLAEMEIDAAYPTSDEQSQYKATRPPYESLNVSAHMKPEFRNLDGGLRQPGKDHPLLRAHIRHVSMRFRNRPFDEWEGKHGLSLADIDWIAEEMVHLPRNANERGTDFEG